MRTDPEATSFSCQTLIRCAGLASSVLRTVPHASGSALSGGKQSCNPRRWNLVHILGTGALVLYRVCKYWHCWVSERCMHAEPIFMPRIGRGAATADLASPRKGSNAGLGARERFPALKENPHSHSLTHLQHLHQIVAYLHPSLKGKSVHSK